MRKKGSKRFRYNIDVINHLCGRGKSIPEIAKILGCNYWNLLSYLKRNFVCIETNDRIWVPKELPDNKSVRDGIKSEIWSIFYSAYRRHCLKLGLIESKYNRKMIIVITQPPPLAIYSVSHVTQGNMICGG